MASLASTAVVLFSEFSVFALELVGSGTVASAHPRTAWDSQHREVFFNHFIAGILNSVRLSVSFFFSHPLDSQIQIL